MNLGLVQSFTYTSETVIMSISVFTYLNLPTACLSVIPSPLTFVKDKVSFFYKMDEEEGVSECHAWDGTCSTTWGAIHTASRDIVAVSIVLRCDYLIGVSSIQLFSALRIYCVYDIKQNKYIQLRI